MLEQLVLATQLAFENVDSNEVNNVLDKVHKIVISNQTDPINSLINDENPVNALLS